MIDEKKLEGKVAIITGAGHGIGREAALLFARQGARVVVADINPEFGREAVKEIIGKGGEAIFVETDVSKAREVERMVKSTVKKWGKLDILYNNAGIMAPNRSLIDTSEEEWDNFFDTNLKGTFLCSKYAVPEMAKNGGGAIINTASEMGMVGCDGAVAYSASKAGVISLTMSMASEYALSGIRVNCISPGTIETRPHTEEESLQIIKRVCPSGRMGRPEEVANVALFLASEDSSFVSGVNLEVGGGAPLCRVPRKKYL